MNKQRQGISLIVLVITIIVMLILASAIVITLSNTNIITKAREATLKTDVKNFEQELSLSLADKKLEDSSFDMTTINASSLEDIQEYIPSFTDKYEGKLCIKNGELALTPAEIKAQVEAANIAAAVSTTDITPYVSGIKSKQAEQYTIFQGNLYYRYEKTTYEEQKEIYAAGIPFLLGDANEDGTLTEEDAQMINDAELNFVYTTDNTIYICNVDGDDMLSSADGTLLQDILVGTFVYEDYINMELQEPDKVLEFGQSVIDNGYTKTE